LWGSLASILGIAVTLLWSFRSSPAANAVAGPQASLRIDSVELRQNAYLAVIDLRVRNAGDRVALVGSAEVEVLSGWEFGRTDLADSNCKPPRRSSEFKTEGAYTVDLPYPIIQLGSARAVNFARKIDGNGVDRFDIQLFYLNSEVVALAEVVIHLRYNGNIDLKTRPLLIAAGDEDQTPWLSRLPPVLQDEWTWLKCEPAARVFMLWALTQARRSLAINRMNAAAIASRSVTQRSDFAGRVLREFVIR
jgi:hypothetical protein